MRTHRSRGPLPLRGRLVGAGFLAVAVLISALAPAAAQETAPGPSSSVAPAASGPPAACPPAGAASPAPCLPAGAVLTFRALEDADLGSLTALGGVRWLDAGADGTIVALAECGRGACTRVLRSTDGTDWQVLPATLPGSPAGLAWAKPGFVALTSKDAKALAHRSIDGSTWETVTVGPLGLVPALTAAPEGFLAFGCDGKGCSRGTAWSSPDGATWTREAPEAARGFVLSKAAFGPLARADAAEGDPSAAPLVEALVAIGFSPDDGTPIALRRDGDEWEAIDLPLPKAWRGGRLELRGLMALPAGGFAIVGEYWGSGGEAPSDLFVLSSADGREWALDDTSLDPGTDPVVLFIRGVAAAGPARLIAAHLIGLGGEFEGRNEDIILSSVEGDGWVATSLPVGRRESALVEDMATLPDGRIVVAGSAMSRRGERPALWLGSFTAPE